MATKQQLISLLEEVKAYMIANEKRLPESQWTNELCEDIQEVLEEEKPCCPLCLSTDIFYPEKDSPNDDVVECGNCSLLFESSRLI